MEIQTFYYAIGAIVATATVIIFVFRVINKKWSKVEKLDEKVSSDLSRIESVEGQVRIVRRQNRLFCLAMISILKHLETGNDTEEMRRNREKLEDEFTDNR